VKEKNIVYKIVGKRNRRGSNFTLFFTGEKYYKFSSWKRIKKNRELWVKLEKYFPIYKNGAIINSVKGSPGIMCFENMDNVDIFLDRERFRILGISYRIIKVKGIGRKKIRPAIQSRCGGSISNLIFNSWNTMKAPIGTVTYKSVKVLE
jgi:hypothetical protein